ncbi:MAG: recombinase family protein [Peptoanaerobacter stomatis]|uniref:recombinase family protein n=1 Tax=Peptoanaerobacter stomatis TaxID=796937 RepID=UPI003F9FFD5A
MKVVAYARYSSDNQREESIDAQIRAIKKYCKENKYILLNIYIDEARTGTNQNRPQFQQMLKSAKNKEFEAVVVHKFDRFSRNKMDAVRIKYELKQQGVKVLSILEPLNGTPEDVIIESLYEGMAEYYSLNLAREVRKGMLENAEKGLTTGGTAPLGFGYC